MASIEKLERRGTEGVPERLRPDLALLPTRSLGDVVKRRQWFGRKVIVFRWKLTSSTSSPRTSAFLPPVSRNVAMIG